ncbi:MAG: hypothetical protein CVU55_15740 [Deltaproteobacteria bacterium HGW-Deltaproteobacteria-13]|nr:MAG: hypothetical protein CVU55_15740 [Deltaproteobacteria bacterium HGW-Deltaproteobacteria-13]
MAASKCAENDTSDGSAGNDLKNFLISMGFHSILGGGLGADTMLSGFVPGYTVYMVDNPNNVVRERDKIMTGRSLSSAPFIYLSPKY